MILYVDKNNNVLDIESSSTLSKYKQTITKNGNQTEFIINHNLNTEDVIVQMDNGEVPIFIDWKVIDENNIKLSFDGQSDDGANYNVTIFGSGNSSNGGGYSSEDIQELRNNIDELRQSFQDGVDTIYNKCVSEGSTPTENSPSAISNAIGNLRGEGNATSTDILFGKTAYANKQLVTGSMTNNGEWNFEYCRKIKSDGSIVDSSESVIPKGYHNGNGRAYLWGGTIMPYLIQVNGADVLQNIADGSRLYPSYGIGNLPNGLFDNDYTPYLFILYNVTKKQMLDCAMQRNKHQSDFIDGLYGNCKFKIDDNYTFNFSFNNLDFEGDMVWIIVYSFGYGISFY